MLKILSKQGRFPRFQLFCNVRKKRQETETIQGLRILSSTSCRPRVTYKTQLGLT